LCRQIDRDKWTKAGLHIRQKENEPVETTQTPARRRRYRFRRHRLRSQPRDAIINGGPLKAVTIDPVDWALG
jgi:hypothetical protein